MCTILRQDMYSQQASATQIIYECWWNKISKNITMAYESHARRTTYVANSKHRPFHSNIRYALAIKKEEQTGRVKCIQRVDFVEATPWVVDSAPPLIFYFRNRADLSFFIRRGVVNSTL